MATSGKSSKIDRSESRGIYHVKGLCNQESVEKSGAKLHNIQSKKNAVVAFRYLIL
jgi:hypothetical protein